MEPSKHSQLVDDATVIQTMLGKGTIKDLHPSLELPKASLDMVADATHHPVVLGLLQKEQRSLVPWSCIDHRFFRPAAVEVGQLLEELHGSDQGPISADAQVEDATGGWINRGPDPAEPSAQFDASFIDHDGIWQGVIPHRPVIGEGLNPISYGDVRNADSQSALLNAAPASTAIASSLRC